MQTPSNPRDAKRSFRQRQNRQARLVMYTLTATSAVVMGAALLISEMPGDVDGAVEFMVVASFAFAFLAIWMHGTIDE